MNSASQVEVPSADADVVGESCRTAPHPSHGASKENARRPLLKGTAWRYLAALSIAVDFLVVPTFVAFFGRGGLAIALPFAGCLLAQGSLLAAWLVWGDAPFSRRLLWHWIIAGGLCCVWLVGLALAAPPHRFLEIGFTVALTVPVVSLGAQFPMWITRLLFGWRLVRTPAPSAAATPTSEMPPVERPLSIRDLLFATLIVGASFAVARLSPAAQQEEEFRFVWGVYMAAAAIVSLIAILPAAAILLRPRPLLRAIQYSLYLAAAPIALVWMGVVVALIYARGALAPWYEYVGASLFFLSYAGTAILAAVVARDQGYLLDWGRRRRYLPS